MKAKILKTETDYDAALARVERLMDAEPGTPQAEELELWSLLVKEYERHHYPIDPPDPIEAIKFRMEQLGLQQKDLTRFIPAKSKVSEVLNRKRNLSLPMIRALNQHLGISAEILVREPQAAYGKVRVKKKVRSQKTAGGSAFLPASNKSTTAT